MGATASGKTKLAVALAARLNAEIISADSRQVYKHLDIGTGKDLLEYNCNGVSIPHHGINVCEPEEQFYLHQFIDLLDRSFLDITSRKKLPIIAGGTGLYLDAIKKDFSLTAIPENAALREELQLLSKSELLAKLDATGPEGMQHVDRNSSKRLIRALEIAQYLAVNRSPPVKHRVAIQALYIGIQTSAEERTYLIKQRLEARLKEGLIEEAQALLQLGITHNRLQHFGLEYKFLSFYLQNKLSRSELETQLATAILQFSKRQMTWFRKMEKEGIRIHWFKRENNLQEIIDLVEAQFESKI